MKKCLAAGIVLLFIGTAIAPLNAQDASKYYASPSGGNTCYAGGGNGTDFTVNISGQTFWMVIKLTFPPKTNITFWHNSTASYNHSKYGYFIYMYTSSDFQHYLDSMWGDFLWCDPEVYCHIGALNWSIAHNKSLDHPDWGDEHFYGQIPWWWFNGSWYLIFISSATNRSLSVHIHADTSGSIAVERGDTVVALDRDNFLGGINVGWRRGVCMVNTQRTLEVKHFFPGWFGMVSWNGFYLLSCQMPNGTSRRLFGLDFLGHNMNFTMDVWGPSGTWRFHATMMNIALLKIYPRVYLAGADIILPS
jgi:hypothetical protein